MAKYYILKGKTPVEEPNFLLWKAWMEAHLEECILLSSSMGEYLLTTLFTGENKNPQIEPPLVFQTAIWMEGNNISKGERYASYEDALQGHQETYQSIQAFQASELKAWRESRT